MMIERSLAKHIIKAATQLPVIVVTGPRQSGKTTLVRDLFKDKPYVNFENLDDRMLAKQDPRGFLAQFSDGVVLDEVQTIPELFSYIQLFVDEHQKPGHVILTGSQNFLLMESISQSLAGRTAIFHLLPLSLEEVGTALPLKDQMVKGFYPRLYQHDIDAKLFYQNYIATYVERDVRMLKNVQNLSQFQLFMQLCSHRVGQLLNLSSLALDAGISVNTAKQWLSLLEASYVIYLLRPYHQNYGKRLVKMPKLYFCDVGLATHLANIRPEDLEKHPLKGLLFENMLVMEFYKRLLPDRPALYFWRDKSGHEIDCLIERGSDLLAIEIKSSQTIQPSFSKNLMHWKKLNPEAHSYVVYGGPEERSMGEITYRSWKNLDKFAL